MGNKYVAIDGCGSYHELHEGNAEGGEPSGSH
jgi:hypothetical protein